MIALCCPARNLYWIKKKNKYFTHVFHMHNFLTVCSPLGVYIRFKKRLFFKQYGTYEWGMYNASNSYFLNYSKQFYRCIFSVFLSLVRAFFFFLPTIIAYYLKSKHKFTHVYFGLVWLNSVWLLPGLNARIHQIKRYCWIVYTYIIITI